MNWIKSFLKNWSLTLGVSVLLLLTVDFFAGEWLLYDLSGQYKEQRYRIVDPIFHHTLAPNFDGFGEWGAEPYRVCTDSFGFKSSCDNSRQIHRKADLVFIGDSFTEGIGLPYEDTFVGQIAKSKPELIIVNMGVASYSPTIYLAKVKKFLDEGFDFKELIVYVDISDAQDEAIDYRYVNGVVTDKEGETGIHGSVEIKTFFRSLFPLTYQGLHEFKMRILKPSSYPYSTVTSHPTHLDRNFQRSAWTYNSMSEGYGVMGVNAANDKSIEMMSQLYEILSQKGIKLSVGVYPWPSQLLFDKRESRQVEIWKNFCENRCVHFYNSFPIFFEMSEKHGIDGALDKFFMKNDVHHNANGSKLIATDFLNGYKN